MFLRKTNVFCAPSITGSTKCNEGKLDLEEEYKQRIARKEACNEEKRSDKERAERDKEFVSVTFDLQAILQIPSDEVGHLTVYSLTIYENALPNEAYCFA